MSAAERFACCTGTILIGFATMLMLWNEDAVNGRRRRNAEPPVEILAEELKDAWAEYHTR
jgi:hypothetical protein